MLRSAWARHLEAPPAADLRSVRRTRRQALACDVVRRLLGLGAVSLAAEFAASHFRRCDAHQRHAMAVYSAIEVVCLAPLTSLDVDATIHAILHGRIRVGRVHERRLALVLADYALLRLVPHLVMELLLGKTACRQSSWDPASIWARRVRDIIDERVVYDGGCSCGTRVPSNDAMQLTRPG